MLFPLSVERPLIAAWVVCPSTIACPASVKINRLVFPFSTSSSCMAILAALEPNCSITALSARAILINLKYCEKNEIIYAILYESINR